MIYKLNKIKITLVLPVYSSDASFITIINKNCAALAKSMPAVNWTVIIVNDGSPVQVQPDFVRAQLTAPVNYQYIHYPQNKGKGFAVRFGFSRAPSSDIFIYTDYDFPFGVESIRETADILLENKAAIVAGIRGRDYYQSLPVFRQFVTSSVRLFNKYIFRLQAFDSQAGLKGMNKYALAVLQQTTLNGFLFDLQFIRKAQQRQHPICCLPVDCNKQLIFKNFTWALVYKEIKTVTFHLLKKKMPNFCLSPSGPGIKSQVVTIQQPATLDMVQRAGQMQEAG